MSVKSRESDREAAEAVGRIAKFGSATIHEAIGRSGDLPHEIKPVARGMKVCGPAFTVEVPPGSNLALHYGLYAAAPGDVLVVSVRGAFDFGYWGEIMAHAAIQRPLGGLVIDGCVRDADLLEQFGFPVFARGLCIRGTEKYPGGSLGGPLVIGRTVVSTGDIVVGDRDGVVVVPRAQLAAAIEASEAREKKEQGVMDGLSAGGTTLELFKFPTM
jgi:4-hydroxy-4-methyl-2-oxoglutarate aldolase